MPPAQDEEELEDDEDDDGDDDAPAPEPKSSINHRLTRLSLHGDEVHINGAPPRTVGAAAAAARPSR